MEPYPNLLILLNIVFKPVTLEAIISLVVILVLLLASALISGSEVAFFSLTPKSIKLLKEKKNRKSQYLLDLLKRPERLLATILISNNFVNIAIIVLSTFITNLIVDLSQSEIGIIIQIFIVTFLLLLFGEIIPKVYANHSAKSFAVFMTYPLFILQRVFYPISTFLIYSTSIVNKRFHNKNNISIDDLSEAFDLTSHSIKEDKEILEGIVKFGNIDVKAIMKSRLDVVAINIKDDYDMAKLKSVIAKFGYSRIPVYNETFDNVVGILYIKDLLPHLDKGEEFNWQTVIRHTPYFVPETKKIDDLFDEFRKTKTHMAIVIDEYGGTQGIVTLEDILEEIVGDIIDEFDEDKREYSKIDDNNYIFDGKILLNDFYKIVKTDDNVFDKIKGDAETLAGLILEIKGEIPKKNSSISYANFIFRIEAVNKRRIEKIKLTVN